MDYLHKYLRETLELLSFVSTIVLPIFAAYGLKQIRLMKLDMKHRSERASKEKAIAASSEYLNEFVPLDSTFYLECEKKKINYNYPGSIGNFTSESIPASLKRACLKKYLLLSWLPALNKLEAIAAIFTTGVGDEQVGFRIIGRTFCVTVRSYYDILATSHSEVARHYTDVIELYKIWSARLSKSEMINTQSQLARRIDAIPEAQIPIIESNN